MLQNPDVESGGQGATSLPSEVELTLGPVAYESFGGSSSTAEGLERGVLDAVRAFLADEGTAAVEYPGFLRRYDSSAAVVVSCRFAPIEMEQLERDSKQAGITVEQLVTRAVLFHVARKDADRKDEDLLERLPSRTASRTRRPRRPAKRPIP
ncbi:MAG TPA: hypothetical protein VGG40_11890 [Solirubrobacterales bacterium]